MTEEIQSLSYADAANALQALEAKKAALEAAMHAKREEARGAMVESIKFMIKDSGFTLDDILPDLTTRPRKARTGAPSNVVSLPVWRLTADPSKTYVRGVLPAWLKSAMVAAGLDPTKKEDREAFKAANMVREAA